MQYYFDRTDPLFIRREDSYNGVPIDIEPGIGEFMCELRDIFEDVRNQFNTVGAPEDSAQFLTQYLVNSLGQTTLLTAIGDALLDVEDDDEWEEDR